MQNMLPIFYCEICHYKCCKKSSWSQHLMTSKHEKAKNGLMQANKKYACEKCAMEFNHQSSYCRHKKKCIQKETIISIDSKMSIENKSNIELLTHLIETQMKENKELRDILQEQNKIMMKMSENTNSITNINSNNKTFNLNVFLNEHCKDAMNIMDFVDSLKLQLSDLENVGKLGFVEGISNIIVKKLKEMDIHKRPVHCSDSKREVMYIKDENKWERENNEKVKLRKAIKHIAHKNSKLIPEFRAKYPDCGKSNSKYSDQFNKLVIEAMGGSGNEDIENENKIIKNIAKEVTIIKNID